jgi:hypothetical protein
MEVLAGLPIAALNPLQFRGVPEEQQWQQWQQQQQLWG